MFIIRVAVWQWIFRLFIVLILQYHTPVFADPMSLNENGESKQNNTLLFNGPTLSTAKVTKTSANELEWLSLTDLTEEPPLSQQDIDTFIFQTDEYIKIFKDSNDSTEALKRLRMSETRFFIVSYKISLGHTILLLDGADLSFYDSKMDSAPINLRPSEEEINLIEANKIGIENAIARITKAGVFEKE